MSSENKKEEDPSVVEQRQRIINYKKVFGSDAGKAVLFDLMNRFHVLNEHGGDPFKEGQRSVALHIFKKCKIDLKEFDKLLNGE